MATKRLLVKQCSPKALGAELLSVWCASQCADSNGPRNPLMCKCCANRQEERFKIATDSPKFFLGTRGMGCSNPPFSAVKNPEKSGFFGFQDLSDFTTSIFLWLGFI